MSFFFQPKNFSKLFDAAKTALSQALTSFFVQPYMITFLCFILPVLSYDGFLNLLMKVEQTSDQCFGQQSTFA